MTFHENLEDTDPEELEPYTADELDVELESLGLGGDSDKC